MERNGGDELSGEQLDLFELGPLGNCVTSSC
jgi:hypothetical protein